MLTIISTCSRVSYTDCPIHSGALIQLKPPKEFATPQVPLHKPAPIKTAWSAFVPPPPGHAHHHTPRFVTADDSQTARTRKKRSYSQMNHYGQLGPISQGRAIVINSTHNAPDPFSILTREK